MNRNIETELLVVGGGPAGLLAAETAASAGCSTILIEKEQEIGSPVHTSGATALATMRQFQIPAELFHSITRLRLRSPNEEAIFEQRDPIGCIIDVRGTYQSLAERARRAGAVIFTSTQANRPLFDSSFVAGCNVSSSSGEQIDIRSKVVVDASGYRCVIARQTGLHEGFRRFGVGAEYELIAPNCRQDEAVLIVGNEYAPSGYAWVFPWGENRVRVGVGILHTDSRVDPKDQLSVFLEKARRFDVDLTGATVVGYHFGLIPSDGLARGFVGNGVMAAGDAAGQASLVVGEGIRLSMWAGQLAGKVGAQAVADGHWDKAALLPYERKFRSRYARNLAIGHIVNTRMSLWDDVKWDEQVRVVKTVPVGLLAKLLQSEFSIAEIVPWIAVRPFLWPKAIRYALKGLLVHVRGS